MDGYIILPEGNDQYSLDFSTRQLMALLEIFLEQAWALQHS